VSVQESKMRLRIGGEPRVRISRPACSGLHESSQGYHSRKGILQGLLIGLVVLCALALFACDLIPPKPEAVFILYRDRMKAGSLQEARSLLSPQSRSLVEALLTDYQLRHPPENLALLNILDPVTAPVAIKTGDTRALLRVRTLKGGLRLIRLERKSSDDPWSIDLSEELKSFESFLRVRAALETIREQAGEYAATLKAFEDQMRNMNVPELREKPRSKD
jgi:hypothetical protein